MRWSEEGADVGVGRCLCLFERDKLFAEYIA
jgi:hypothetical protein